MDYLRKTKDKLLQSVGLADRVPDDAELEAASRKIKLMLTTINSMKKTVTQYARSMLLVGESSRRLADDISRFYARSESHQESVQLFFNAQLDQESNVLFLFKEQFGYDVEREFDLWYHDVKVLLNKINTFSDHHANIASLRQKVDAGAKQPNAYTSNGKTGAQVLQQDQLRVKKLEEQYAAHRKTILAEAEQAVQRRYARFDGIFIRLLEFQKDFFTDGLECTDKYQSVVDDYRKTVRLPSTANVAPPQPSEEVQAKPDGAGIPPSKLSSTSSSGSSALAPTAQGAGIPHGVSVAASPSKPATLQPASPSPSSKASQQSVGGGAIQADILSPTSSTQSQPASDAHRPAAAGPSRTEASTPRTATLFDFAFDDQPSSSSSSSGPTRNVQRASSSSSAATGGGGSVDLLGDLFDSSASSTSGAKPSSGSQQTQVDLFSLDINTHATQQPLSTTSSYHQNTTPATPTAAGHEFDMDFFSSPVNGSGPSRSTTQPGLSSSTSFAAPSSSAGGLDDIDDDMTSPTPSQGGIGLDDDLLGGFNFSSKPSSTATFGTGGGDFDSFDPLSSSSRSSSAQPSQPSSTGVQPNPTYDGPELSAAEESQMIQDYKRMIDLKVQAWQHKHGVECDIIQLLSSLHTVLWTNHNWKKVDTTQLLDYNSVKRTFRRALLTVHPDKVSNGSPEMKATADVVFEILNQAFKRYEVSLGMRSA